MLSRRCVRRERGASIVEMVFTVALLAILLSMAVPSFAGWLERSRVRGAAESIHAGIQLARSEALARNARVRFVVQPDGSWTVACTAVTPGCADTSNLHTRSGEESRGAFGMSINGANASANAGVTFLAPGRVDTGEAGHIAQIDLVVPTQFEEVLASRALRLVISDFGQTRMCYPHASTGSPTRC